MPNKCEHNRIRSRCKECRGGSICDHGRVRGSCSLCAPEQVFNMYRRKAVKRGLPFELTVVQFIQIVQSYCVFCGEKSAPRGVDRRDNNIGYVYANCQSCCGPCNKLKSAEIEQAFLRHVLKIAKYQEALKPKKIAALPPLPETPDHPKQETESIKMSPVMSVGRSLPAEARCFLEGY